MPSGQPELTEDVLKDKDMVNAYLIDRVNHRTVFGNAFSEQDVSEVNDSEVSFFVEDGVYDRTELPTVDEASEFPERDGEKRRVRCQRHKYGEKYEMSMEAGMDARLDEIALEAERKMNRLGNTIDAVAYRVLAAAANNNDHNDISPSGTNGELTYDDFVDAGTDIRGAPEGEYAPTDVFVGHGGLGDVLKMSEFTHATDAADDTIRYGTIGGVAGLGSVNTSASPFIDMPSGTAFVVDGDYLGRRAEWVGPTVRRGSDFDRQVDDIMQLFSLFGYVATHPNAVQRIQ